MDKKKLIPACLGTLLAIPILAGCGEQKAVQVNGPQNSDKNAPDTVSQTQETYLAVDPNKCIGCGRCVQTDSAHFIIDSGTRKSTVISQSDLGSDKLASAISGCPVDAITL